MTRKQRRWRIISVTAFEVVGAALVLWAWRGPKTGSYLQAFLLQIGSAFALFGPLWWLTRLANDATEAVEQVKADVAEDRAAIAEVRRSLADLARQVQDGVERTRDDEQRQFATIASHGDVESVHDGLLAAHAQGLIGPRGVRVPADPNFDHHLRFEVPTTPIGVRVHVERANGTIVTTREVRDVADWSALQRDVETAYGRHWRDGQWFVHVMGQLSRSLQLGWRLRQDLTIVEGEHLVEVFFVPADRLAPGRYSEEFVFVTTVGVQVGESPFGVPWPDVERDLAQSLQGWYPKHLLDDAFLQQSIGVVMRLAGMEWLDSQWRRVQPLPDWIKS